MKKAILLLAVLMLLTAVAMPVFATDTEVTISTPNDIYYRGENVVLTVNISGDVPYTILKCQILFDEAVFEYVSYDLSADVPAEIFRFNEDKKSFALTFREPTAYAGTIGTVTLKVKEGSSFDPSTIKVDAEATDTVSDKDKDITLSIVEKSVQIAIGCRHNYTWVNTDDTTHTGTCSLCGDVKTEKHGWGEGFNITPATCTEPGSETQECLLCHTQKTVRIDPKGHAWDNDCDPNCNNGCGETRETGHKYAEKFSSDADKHWHACTVCGDKGDLTAHVPGPAATETTAQTCKVCGYEIAPKLTHVHDFSEEWQQDADYHWRICLKKGCYVRMDNATHDYTDACDVTCNTCGHIRVAPHQYGMEWRGSDLGHWQDCLLCGNHSDISEHIPGAPATADTPQVCTECNFWIQYPLNHEHTLDDVWSMDDNNHWKYCTECSAHCEEAPHNWDEGTVLVEATETQNGSIRYVCKDCGAERIDLILATGTQTDPTETDPIVPTTPQSPNPAEKDEFPWWILIALAGVLLLTGIVLFVIELIRSKKHNSHGKYSK
ncbi:MAG: hypothetical protein E7470_03695 [Ruminococcaceae bacterium]|nr:hypothetical protein [Oscillospiraceae bacterium]